MEILELMFRSIWHFVGMCIVLTGVGNFTLIMWNRFFRHWNIRKHGYPPSHCDADGDYIETD